MSRNNYSKQALTPVWTPHHCAIRHTTRLRSHPKVCQFNGSIFVCEDIGTFDISMNNTLVMEVNQSFQHLRYINSNETFRKLSESLGNVVQGTILTEPRWKKIRSLESPTHGQKEKEETNSRIMYRYSRVLTNPLYLTILGC